MGANLREARLDHRLSIKALAHMMDITPGYLGLIEGGKRGLTAFMMHKASQILEIRVSELYKRQESDGYGL